MNLSQKIAKKLREGEGKRITEAISNHDTRDWARRPRSQKAVEMAIEAGLEREIAEARKAGYVEGDRWIPPEKRKKNNGNND